MMDPLDSFRRDFKKRLPRDLQVLKAAEAARPGQEAIYVVHRLSGMAAVLGHEDIADLALTMDDHAADTGGFAENDLAALISALEALG